jgi:hypothetical protein
MLQYESGTFGGKRTHQIVRLQSDNHIIQARMPDLTVYSRQDNDRQNHREHCVN